METARWIVAAVAGLLSLFFIVGNPVAGIVARRRGRNYSAIPLLGAILGVVACVACPALGWSWWILLPLALDVTVPMLVVAVILDRRG